MLALQANQIALVAKPTLPEIRKKTGEILRELEEEKRVNHSSRLTQQGVWTHWDNVQPFDFSWRNLIYGPGPKVIAFVLNAQINSVKTPDMMKAIRLLLSAPFVNTNIAPSTTS